MSIKTKGLAVIQWPVSNVEKSVAWYQKVLGVSLTFPFQPGDQEAWLNLGNAGFGLIQCEEIPTLEFIDTYNKVQPIVQFQVENIHEVYEELQNKGVNTGDMVYKEEGGYSFTFYDLDGHAASLWGGWPSENE
ncbi:hypothetical protein GCM10008967_13050 [Bacillus carboniphilus]|uniref:VOC domain-containing protein n=1 Tax=Bacillus carboniphilus TaxID=86663 RepID=A0ABN0W366_9BACI